MAPFSLDDFFTAYHGCDPTKRKKLEAWLCEHYRLHLSKYRGLRPPPPIEIVSAVQARTRKTPWQILNARGFGIDDAKALISLVMTDGAECGQLLQQYFPEPTNTREQILKEFLIRGDDSVFRHWRPHSTNIRGYWLLFMEIVEWLRETQSAQQRSAHG